MRFWDSSAVVPLMVEEATSRACRECLRSDRTVVVWCMTRVEVISALCRLEREGGLRAEDLPRAAARLERLALRWREVDAVPLVREAAERLLRIHPLRAADAVQLGAALVLVDHAPRHRAFVCLDDALCAAASAEGFDVITPHG